jgi:hypothetical protein
VSSVVTRAAGQLPAGERPSRTRAFFAAVVTAGVTGVFVYKLLRSGGDWTVLLIATAFSS